MALDYTHILPTGKKNAIPAKYLANKLMFKSTRALQADIAKARAEGQVICSSTTGGYYLPADRAEIEEFVAILKARACNTFVALKSAREALGQHPGQQSLDEFLNQ
ncbi:MAG: hypothetical protein PUC12_06390 [Clostridiales bacterium]|nr:hypothetical protein [Clostridiales bacterium]